MGGSEGTPSALLRTSSLLRRALDRPGKRRNVRAAPAPSPALWGQPPPTTPCGKSEKAHLHLRRAGPCCGPRNSGEDEMDMGLSSWSLEPRPERNPSHVTSKGLAGRSKGGLPGGGSMYVE